MGEQEVGYDVRRGAAAYSPIVGTFGAFVVPAIVVLFTVRPTRTAPNEATLLTFAVGLMVIVLLSSLVGAFGLAAVGAEKVTTANLPVATMYFAIPVVISVTAMLASFEVLAEIYLPGSSSLFWAITLAGAWFGMLFTAFAIEDSARVGPFDPTDATVRDEWLETQWISSPPRAARAAAGTALLGTAPILVAMSLRISRVQARVTIQSVHWLVGLGLALALFGAACGLARTIHPVGSRQYGLKWQEAGFTSLFPVIYAAVLVLYLP